MRSNDAFKFTQACLESSICSRVRCFHIWMESWSWRFSSRSRSRRSLWLATLVSLLWTIAAVTSSMELKGDKEDSSKIWGWRSKHLSHFSIQVTIVNLFHKVHLFDNVKAYNMILRFYKYRIHSILNSFHRFARAVWQLTKISKKNSDILKFTSVRKVYEHRSWRAFLEEL
jgi:hypothetical protein